MEDLVQRHLATLALDEPNRFPMNEGDGAESSTDTLTGTEDVLVTATLARPLRASSKVLLVGACQVNNDAAAARQITLRLRRSNSNDSTMVQELVVKLEAAADDRDIVTFAVADSPNTTIACTYSMRGLTDGGSPTATNKSLVAIEIPQVTKFP